MAATVMNDSAHGQAFAVNEFTGKDEELAGKTIEVEAIDGGKVPITVGVAKGEWYQVGYHMCVSVAASSLLGLPYAMGLLGWAPGVIALSLAFGVTLWTSRIVASFHEHGGKRHIRYRDLAACVAGPWAKWVVWPSQWTNLIGFTISVLIQSGLSLKAIASLLGPESSAAQITLTEWIAIYTGVAMLFTQIGTFHELWWINMTSMINTYAFTFFSVSVAIYQAVHFKGEITRDYGVHGSPTTKAMGIFSAVVIMHFAYGNTIIPEIQATAKPPSVKTMNKAIWMLYTQLALCFFPSAFIGYAAFGSNLVSAGGSFLPFYMASIPSADNPSPVWALVLINLLILWNGIPCCMLYSRPVMELVETHILDAKAGLWSLRNWILRTSIRCFYLFLCGLVAAMFPYFGDVLALVGALGVTPIDFLLPLWMYIALRKPKGWKLWLNSALLIFYFCIMILGAIAAVRSIVLDASKYSVFANL